MKYYSLAELRDSRLLYDKNPPPFLFVLIAVIFIALAGLLIASFSIHKPYVVKAQGTITSTQKIPLTVNVQGTITAVNLKEGKSISIGDTIMRFDDSQVRAQVQQYDTQAKYYQKQIDLYNSCVKQINKGTNTFHKDDPDESAFYSQIQLMQSKIAQYSTTDDQYKAMGYTDDQIKTQQAQNQAQRDSAKFQTISDLETQESQLQTSATAAKAQRDAYAALLDSYIVKATQSGTVHLDADIKPGMIVQPGTVIGSIAVNAPSDLTVETYVSAQDRSKIRVGSPAQISISGIMQNDYGVLRGKITEIDTDATINQNKGSVYYKALIQPDKTILNNKNGQTISIKSGMVTQSNIQYKDGTWFQWILEQIGIKSV